MAEKRLSELKTIEIIQTEQQRSNRLKKKWRKPQWCLRRLKKKKKGPHCCHWGCKRREESG